MRWIALCGGSGRGRAPKNEKLQTPSTREVTSLKLQARTHLKLGAWSFPEAWCLSLGVFPFVCTRDPLKRARNSLFFLIMILLATAGLAGASEEKRNAPSAWARSIVTLDVARKHYDYYQPWSTPMRQAQKIGTVIGDRQILTTAEDLFERTLVRLQKGGRGRWWIGEVAWIDYHANLALVTTAEADFWSELKPVALDRAAPSNGRLQILRWQEGNFETRGAEFTRYAVREGQLSPVTHVVLEAASEIQNAGRGEPVIANSRLVGIVRAQEGRNCIVIPVSFIESILDARKKGEYRGLGYFHFYWQRAENPASLEFLKLAGRPRGVIVVNVPDRADGYEPALKPRDIILKIDGFDLDIQGDYNDPEFGHLMLENLSTRRKWAGDNVGLQLWREGKPLEITYRLPKFEYTNSLVPYATYDVAPEYLIVGGLVFQPLTDSFLQSWGPEWKQQAPFRLNYYNDEPPTKDRPALVLLSQVLPDGYNIGYQEQHGLVVDKVNGQRVNRLTELRDALLKPTHGFHVIEFVPGDSLQRAVLAAGDAEREATQRVLERFGIAESCRLAAETGR